MCYIDLKHPVAVVEKTAQISLYNTRLCHIHTRQVVASTEHKPGLFYYNSNLNLKSQGVALIEYVSIFSGS